MNRSQQHAGGHETTGGMGRNVNLLTVDNQVNQMTRREVAWSWAQLSWAAQRWN